MNKKEKEILEKISFAMTLRIRGYEIDIECGNNKIRFNLLKSSLVEFQKYLSDIKYINDYIQMKEKYMSDDEKKKWLESSLREKPKP